MVHCNDFKADYGKKYRWLGSEQDKIKSHKQQIKDAPENLRKLNKALQIHKGLVQGAQGSVTSNEIQNNIECLNLIGPKAEEVIKDIGMLLPPVPEKPVKDWVCKPDGKSTKGFTRDNVASAANGPFCLLQPAQVGYGGSCALETIQKACNLTKSTYPIQMIRLVGAATYVKMKPELGIQYSQDTLVALLGSSGWTCIEGVRAITSAMKKTPVTIQPMSYNGRKNDLYYVQSLLANAEQHGHSKDCKDDIIILSTSNYGEQVVRKQVDGTYEKEAAKEKARYAKIGQEPPKKAPPREYCIHYVPCSYDVNGLDLDDKAADIQTAIATWVMEAMLANNVMDENTLTPHKPWIDHVQEQTNELAQRDRDAKWQVSAKAKNLRAKKDALEQAIKHFNDHEEDREASFAIFEDIASYAGVKKGTTVTAVKTKEKDVKDCRRLSLGIRHVVNNSPVSLSMANRQSYVPRLDDDDEVTARMEYQLLDKTAKKIGQFASEDQCHSFYAAAALDLGIPANWRNIQLLRLATVQACLEASNKGLAAEHCADQFARAMQNFEPTSEPCKFSKECFARAMKCNLRVIVTLSDLGIANKVGLTKAVTDTFAVDVEDQHRTISMAYSPDKGHRPLGEFYDCNLGSGTCVKVYVKFFIVHTISSKHARH